MIVHVVTQEESGGAQRLAVRLCRAHRAAGIPAETWFLYRKQTAFAGEPGVRTLLPGRPSLEGLPGLLARLRSDLTRCRPQAVVAHTHWANLLVPPVARAAGVRRRLAVLHSPLGSLPLPGCCAELCASLHPAATARVAVAPGVARACPPWLRPVVIANGIEEQPPGDGGAMRLRLGLRPEDRLAAAVGRLSPEKGHCDLVQALIDIPHLHAAIAGEGPMADGLHRQAEAGGVAGRLHLLGALPASEVADLLAAADLFVMPSRFEGLSLALLEAMQAGCPVVASDIPGNRDALGADPACAGLLVPMGDPAALAAAVRRVLDDAVLAANLRVAAIRRARAFAAGAMVAAWHRLLGVA